MSKKVFGAAERGNASVKLLIVGAILFFTAHAGYNYIPIAYQGESMKQEMQTAVLQGTAMPGRNDPISLVKQRLQKSAAEYQLPADAVIDVKQVNNSIQARVMYKKPVNMFPFGIWTRDYTFDQTVVPTGFLTKPN